MASELDKLQKLSLVSKICNELDSHLGLADKVGGAPVDVDGRCEGVYMMLLTALVAEGNSSPGRAVACGLL